jgi:hypothetical protein
MTYVLLLVALTLTRDDPTTAAPGKSSPAEEFRALRDAHQAAYEAFVKADNEAKTDEDRANVREHPGGRPHDFMPPFLELAKKHPGTTAAEDALLWIATQATSSVAGTKTCTEFTGHVSRTRNASADWSRSIQRDGRTDGCIPATKPGRAS